MKVFCSINALKCFIFVKNHILSNLFFKHKPYAPSSWRHFVSATSFWCPLPLTTLVAPNGTIAPYKMNKLGKFKEKRRTDTFKKIFSLGCMTCHWYKFNLSSSCENLLNVNCNQQTRRSACLRSLNSIHYFASLIAGYLLMLKPAYSC